jgi:hypothetical protein
MSPSEQPSQRADILRELFEMRILDERELRAELADSAKPEPHRRKSDNEQGSSLRPWPRRPFG